MPRLQAAQGGRGAISDVDGGSSLNGVSTGEGHLGRVHPVIDPVAGQIAVAVGIPLQGHAAGGEACAVCRQ